MLHVIKFHRKYPASMVPPTCKVIVGMGYKQGRIFISKLILSLTSKDYVQSFHRDRKFVENVKNRRTRQ